MKKYLKVLGFKSLLTFVNFTSAGWFSVLINVLISIPVKLLFNNKNFSVNMTCGIVGVITMTVVVFLFAAFDGYRKGSFDLKLTMLACGIVTMEKLTFCHFLNAPYAVQFTGWTRLISEAIYFGNSPPRGLMSELYLFIPAIIAFILLYIPAAILGEYLGAKRKQKLTKEIMKEAKGKYD